MASWLPSSIQKRLLRFALARTGLLDDNAIDLDKLDITLGRRNVIELKDVTLNIAKISKLVQLPPILRLETANILLLRLTVPADIFVSSILVDADGVELSLKLYEDGDSSDKVGGGQDPTSAQSPSHRKTPRRIRSPRLGRIPAYDGEGDDDRIPTAQDLARSFLLEEPAQERQELEASVVANSKALDESIVSERSDGADVGTGATLGLPTFLADFLQGIVDRVEVNIKNVSATLDVQPSLDSPAPLPLTFRLCVASAGVAPCGPQLVQDARDGNGQQRRVEVGGVTIEMLSRHEVLSESSQASPAVSFASRKSMSPTNLQTERRRSTPIAAEVSPIPSSSPADQSQVGQAFPATDTSNIMHASRHTADSGRFADANDDDHLPLAQHDSELDIRPGDDNISWGSRRSRAGAASDDMWDSTAGDDDLPDSLLLESTRADEPRRIREGNVRTTNRSPYVPDTQNERKLSSPTTWSRSRESAQPSVLGTREESWSAHNTPERSDSRSRIAASESEQSSGSNLDNKRNALEASIIRQLGPQGSPAQSDVASGNGMSESRIYSHHEAQSMYMSAMTHETAVDMPGAWNSAHLEQSSQILQENKDHAVYHEGTDDPSPEASRPSLGESIDLETRSEAATPRAQSPALSKGVHASGYQTTAKLLLRIDVISVSVPVQVSKVPAENLQANRGAGVGETSKPTLTRDLPGAFSTNSEVSSSRRTTSLSMAAGTESVSWDPQTTSALHERARSPEMSIGRIILRLDLSTVQILGKLHSRLAKNLLGSAAKSSKLNEARHPNASAGKWTLSIGNFELALCESMQTQSPRHKDIVESDLISLRFARIKFNCSDEEKRLILDSISLFIGETKLLSFDRDGIIPTPGAPQHLPDMQITHSSRRTDLRRRAISEFDVRGLVLRINLDLPAIDRVLNSFGGLSSIIELGSSMMAESDSPSSSPKTKKAVTGVRFEADTFEAPASTELKLNAKLEGMSAFVNGQACSVALQTTGFKAVYREQVASATTSRIWISGPHLSGSNDINSVNIDTVRIDYLNTPQDKDLEKFLALLTPSKDKYDNDEDILIETLLRQRRKGSCLRISVDDVRAKVVNWESIAQLEALGNELAQLSAVAKYLPEDDRPGLLTMIRVKDFEARLALNSRFGVLQSTCQDVQCALIGLPALIAFSLSNLKLAQVNGPTLVHAFLPLSGTENLPMVMARMLGNEAEPTVKIKLFNICVEYSVPVLLAMMNEDLDAGTEQVLNDLADSVAGLASHIQGSHKVQSEHSPTAIEKRTKLHILVHNSAIGLSPQQLPSKALFVLTDAQSSLLLPPSESLLVSLELRRAAIFVTDNDSTEEESAPQPRRIITNTATDSRTSLSLAKKGYASAASLMSAHIKVEILEATESLEKAIEVHVRNELLLLETCADSTQTLIATLSALAPSSPPSEQPKYLTEPMSLEDMISSFTGAPVAKPEPSPDTLFDAEDMEDAGTDDSVEFTETAEEPDDLLVESDMASSLYGPISGILGDIDVDDDDEESTRDFAETAESLLEEDPFEMPDTALDVPFSDTTLLKDLRQQSRQVLHDDTVDLDEFEIEDLGFDALGPEVQVLGSRNRFNAPVSKQRISLKPSKSHRFPFKLCLRDIHVILNLHDGYDWQRTRDGISAAVEQVEQRAEERIAKRRQSRNDLDDEESVVGDFLFNSIYIGVPSNQEAQDIRRQINRHIDDLASETESVPLSGISRPVSYTTSGRHTTQRPRRRLKLERSRSHKVAFELKGVSVDMLAYPPDIGEVQSSVDVRVKDFEIFDNVPTSTWRKFLTQLHSEERSREISKPMIHLELLNVKTIQDYAATEIVLHVSVLPLRLHVDQDALDFITRFFEFKDDSAKSPEAPSEQPFLQRVEIDTVDLQLDYKPKKVDYAGLRSGHTTEFINFVILDAANIRLKHAIVYGVRGFEPLHKTLNDVWMPDVQRHQLPTVLAGLAPVRSLVNIGTGVRDVVAIPIREYKKDGRIVRSIQKGAFHFGKTTASELARLGAKVAIGTQNMLQGAEGLLSPGTVSPSGRPGSGRRISSGQGWHNAETDDDDDEKEQRAISAYADQPLGVLAGLRSARRYLEHDLLTARDAFIAVQGEILESSGPGAAAAAVVKHAPTVVLRPVIGASRAVGTTLLGVGNQIDRGNMKRMEDKYKRR